MDAGQVATSSRMQSVALPAEGGNGILRNENEEGRTRWKSKSTLRPEPALWTDRPFFAQALNRTMFDVSWGETFVLFGLGVTLIGRKDLPSELS